MVIPPLLSLPFKTRIWSFSCLIIVASVLANSRALATPDSSRALSVEAPRVRIAICDWNLDGISDTLFGRTDPRFRVLPSHIAWGESEKRATVKKEHTEFHYPANWIEFSGNVAIQAYNTDDSLPDILLNMWGKFRRGNAIVDTVRSIAIFSQKDLDKVGTINVLKIDGFQTTPFTAMDLAAEQKFTEPAKRDISGRTSYVLKRVKLSDRKKEKEASPGDSSTVKPIDRPYAVKVYPNPTHGATQIEASVLPTGEYCVEVLAVNGRQVYHRDVEVSIKGELLRELDLTSLPAGFYIVRVSSRYTTIGAYPIMIVK